MLSRPRGKQSQKHKIRQNIVIPTETSYTLFMESSASEERLPWHSAFFEALQMELDEYRDNLQFMHEYHLTTKPLQIDVVIIKKTANIPIRKNIAAIFRKDNIFEYKSPDKSISVKDFYHAYAYACLYQSLNDKADINELTLTFVKSGYPMELIRHLTEERNYTVEESLPGIYSVKGDILPIQIVDNRRLSAEENLWLKELDNRLGAEQIQRITNEIQRLGSTARVKAYLYVLAQANPKSLQEAYTMSDIALTLDKVLEEVGFTARMEAKAEARGEARGKEEIAQKMLKSGFLIGQVAELSGLDVERIKALAP